MTTKRPLPADVYDTLYLVGYAYGGFGAGSYTLCTADGRVPFCAFGCAWWGDPTVTGGEIDLALRQLSFDVDDNDTIVEKWMRETKQLSATRMPVDLYFERAGFVRMDT